jgi:hypothetical protein
MPNPVSLSGTEAVAVLSRDMPSHCQRSPDLWHFQAFYARYYLIDFGASRGRSLYLFMVARPSVLSNVIRSADPSTEIRF